MSQGAMKRFSLFSWFVFFTLVALALVCWSLNHRLREMERLARDAVQRARELEAQLGVVSAGDPRRLQVVNVRQLEPLRWMWRARLPRGSTMEVRHRAGAVPLTGFPEADGWQRLAQPADGESLIDIEAHIYRNPEQEWVLALRSGESVSNTRLSNVCQAWLNQNLSYSADVEGRGETQEFSVGTPTTLLRVLEREPAQPVPGGLSTRPGGAKVAGGAATGVMIWLQVEPAETAGETVAP